MALYKTRHYGKSHRRIILLLGGWETKQWPYWLPAQLLARRGYHCIVYTYDFTVFSPDADRTVKSLTTISDAIVSDVQALRAQGYSDVSIVSFSLGTMLAFMVADRSPQITKIVVNLTSTEPAEAVWTWDRVRPGFKRSLIRQGLTPAELRKRWAPIAPINNLNHARGKQFLVYLAKRDRLMAYDKAKTILTSITGAGAHAQLITNPHAGHALAGAYNLLNIRRYVKFLNS